MRTAIAALILTCTLGATSTSAETSGAPGNAIQVAFNCVGGVSCVAREGSQVGLTTIEAKGALMAEAGNFVPLQIFNRDTGQLLNERKIGITANGSFAVGIPAYKFPPGNYLFAVRDRNGGKTGVGGYFAIAKSGDLPPVAPQPSAAYKPPEAYQTGQASETAPSSAGNGGFLKGFVDGLKQGLSENQGGDSTSPRDGTTTASTQFLGTWYGANVLAQITIHPDGTYTSPNGGHGTWQASGRTIHFTGALAAWNGGNATLSDKNAIEFKWQTPQLGKQYFALIRR